MIYDYLKLIVGKLSLIITKLVNLRLTLEKKNLTQQPPETFSMDNKQICKTPKTRFTEKSESNEDSNCKAIKQQSPTQNSTKQHSAALVPIIQSKNVERTERTYENVKDIVLGWKINFYPEGELSIEEFLKQVEYLMINSELTEREIFKGMPLLLSGKAFEWFRMFKRNMLNWQDFCKSAKLWWSVRYNQCQLEKEIRKRTQGADESVVMYVINLMALIQMQEPEPSLQDQLNMLRCNLRPDLQFLVPETYYSDLDSFVQAFRDAELCLKNVLNDENSLFPQDVYKPLPVQQNSIEKLADSQENEERKSNISVIPIHRSRSKRVPKKICVPVLSV